MHDLEVADFDGDGAPDVVGRNQREWPAGDDAGQRLHFLWQRRDGTNIAWQPTMLECPPGEGLLAADLDGDGDRDLVVNGTWLENLDKRQWKPHAFARQEDWRHPNTYIATGDLNGDGRLDLALSPSERKGGRCPISWFEAPADARKEGWRAHLVVPDIETVIHFIGAADFDRDGRVDLTYAHMPQGTDPDHVRVLFNCGRRNGDTWQDAWEPMTLSESGSHSMKVLDADSDGRPDLFGANWSAEGRDEHVKLWLNRLPAGEQASGQLSERRPPKGMAEAKPAFPLRVRAYGRFVGERFKDLLNIVWMPGGDYAMPESERWAGHELALGIRDGGGARITAARTVDGRLVILYVPSDGRNPREFSLNLATLPAPLKAHWFNPAVDQALRPHDAPVSNRDGEKFRTPGDNGAGANDWVLVLQYRPG